MSADVVIRTRLDGIAEIGRQLDGLTGQINNFGERLKGIGQRMALSVSAPIAGFAALTIKTAGDFESSMNRIAAVTGATGDAMAAFEQTAKDLGASTKFSASEAASAIETLAKNGLNAQQILGGAVDATLKLASASGSDLATAADLATDAMLQFGLQSEDLAAVVDTMVGSMNQSKFGIDDVRLALGQAGGVAGSVGVDFQDFATAIAATSSAFASGSDAGTSFKTFLQRLAPDSKNARDLIEEMGLEFFDAQGNMRSMAEIAGELQDSFSGLSDEQRIQAASTIFGTDAMRTAVELSKIGAERFSELGEAVNRQGQASEAAAARMKGFEGAMAEFRAGIEALQLAVADSGLLEFATDAVKAFTGFVRTLAEADPQLLKFGTTVAAIFAAAGPVMIGIGAFLAVVGAIPLAIGAAVAAAVAVWVTFGDEITAGARAAVDAVSGMVTAVGDWLGDKLEAAIGPALFAFQKVADAGAWLKDVMVGNSYIPDMVDGIAAEFNRLDAVMVTPAQTAAATIASTFDTVGRNVGQSIGNMVRDGELSLRSFSDTVGSIVDQILNDLIRMTVVNPISQGISGFGSAFASSLFGGTAAAGATGGGLGSFGGSASATPSGAFHFGFDKGGVVDLPTIFPFAKGIGLMGEAGPEAIMPLRRGPDGSLGVQANGGGANVEIRIEDRRGAGAPAIEVDDRSVAGGLRQIRLVIQSEMQRAAGQGVLDKSFRQRYGLMPQPR